MKICDFYFQPKSPPPIDVEVDVSTVASEPSPPPVTDRPKHKPPKKVIKKKKKTASAAQPEGTLFLTVSHCKIITYECIIIRRL